MKRYSEEIVPNKEDFKNIFKKVIVAADYATNVIGVHNRDINPCNVLVRKNGQGLEVRVTDWTNAIKRDTPHDGSLSTAGARIVRDPLLGKNFIEKNEIYSIAHNALIYLNGESAVEYDPDKPDFHSDIHDKRIKGALKKTPRWAKKYRDILWRALCSDENFRYNSIKI